MDQIADLRSEHVYQINTIYRSGLPDASSWVHFFELQEKRFRSLSFGVPNEAMRL